MTTDAKQTVSSVMQFLQLIVLIIGVAGVFMHIGRKDSELTQNTKEIEEIKGIASDLLQTQITLTTNDARLFESLESLRTRTSLLESNR